MPKRERIIQSPYDPPIRLYDNDKLSRKHIIQVGNDIGNIIFKHNESIIEVLGSHIIIEHCLIEQIGPMIDLR